MIKTLLRRRWLMALVLSLAAFGLSAIVSMIRWPTPAIHDEFSYLLAADTFAQSRLTNPTHPFWQHFESFHVIHQPSYSSKYPPGQGLVLAGGQWLAGQPIVGIWILSAVSVAACYWMLLGWVSSRWAAVGGLLFLVHPGFQLGWGQSYWGGTLAFLGGSLVFGAAARMRVRPRAMDALLMSLGALTLAISRPFEGLVFCLIVGTVVLVHWFRHGWPPWRVLVLQTILPQAAVYLLGGTCLAYYSHAVTGDWRTMPYQVHESTYGLSPCFLWNHPYEGREYRHATLTDFHHGWEMEAYTEQQSMAGLLKNKARMFGVLWQFYFPLPMMLPLLFVPFCNMRSKWTLLVVAGAAWLSSVVTVWNFTHYLAPMVPVLLILVLMGLRQINLLGKRHLDQPRLAMLLVALQMISFVVLVINYTKAPKITWEWHRANIVEQLAASPDRHLVLVQYELDHNPLHEWVYNRADIDAAKVVWARPMGPAKDSQLLEYFHDRTVWKLDADAEQPKLIAYEANARGGILSAILPKALP